MGGAEKQWAILLPGLREYGFAPRVLAVDSEGPLGADLRHSGIDVACAGARSRADLRAIRNAVVAAGKCDLVVSHGVSGHCVGAFIALRANAPHVATEHTHYGLLPPSTHRRLMLRGLARWFDSTIAVDRSQIEALDRLGFRVDRIDVIPNGVPIHHSATTRAVMRRSFGLSDSDFAVFFIATLRPEKRPLDFVRAITQASAANERIRGVIVGGGPMLDDVRKSCAARSLLVLGERTDVADLLCAADVVCSTSSHEALSLTILEAMAAGLPVIATDVGGSADAVADGTGWIVQPMDHRALVDALLDASSLPPQILSQMGRAARSRHLESFSVESMIKSYARVLARATRRNLRSNKIEVFA
jgi:glycosyltransferase involved in cell wall biosynthesis